MRYQYWNAIKYTSNLQTLFFTRHFSSLRHNSMNWIESNNKGGLSFVLSFFDSIEWRQNNRFPNIVPVTFYFYFSYQFLSHSLPISYIIAVKPRIWLESERNGGIPMT